MREPEVPVHHLSRINTESLLDIRSEAVQSLTSLREEEVTNQHVWLYRRIPVKLPAYHNFSTSITFGELSPIPINGTDNPVIKVVLL